MDTPSDQSNVPDWHPPTWRDPQQGQPYGPQPEPFGRLAPAPASAGPHGFTAIAWVGIIVGCLMMIGLHMLSAAALPDDAPDEAGPLLMEIQGKYMVGAVEFMSPSPLMYNQADESLNLGSIAQRHRFVVLAAELAGPETAGQVLDDLDDLIEQETLRRARASGAQLRPVMTIDQRNVHELLRFVYGVASESAGDDVAIDDAQDEIDDIESEDADTADDASLPPLSMDDQWQAERQRIAALTDDQKQLLTSKLGWFGDVMLAPPGGGGDDRDDVVMSATLVMIIIVAVVFVLGLVGLCGFVGIIVLIVFALNGKTRSGMTPGRVHHGIYAETFGIWLLLFPMGQAAAGLVALIDARLAMPAVLVAFFGSLLVLAWPVLRGARWSDVRADVGLTLGRKPALEPLLGVAGYAMGLPMLAIGIVLVLLFMAIQGVLSPIDDPFAPAGGGAHPIVLELGGSSIWPKVMILLLAAVAAPIVEEIMFRGVLYRHLRDASRGLSVAWSVIVSAVVSGFIFAAIHPQGWVAVPALMALSFAFVLVREWRGTLIPSILVHAISNFLVMSLLITVLSV